MTNPAGRDERDERPELDQAAEDVAQSTRRADQELAQAREQARHTMTLVRRLRALREDNHFAQLLDVALRGNSG